MRNPRTLRTRLGDIWRRLRWFGLRRHCALCNSRLNRFLPHGQPVRAQSVCPVCQSRERHRLAWLYLSQHVLVPGRACRLLHIAPEPSLRDRLRAVPGVEYVSGDIKATEGLMFDVQRLPFKDKSFDLVYCSHVLNMVDDDVAALAEIARVLDDGGMALVQVPLGTEAATRAATKDWDASRRRDAFGDPGMSHRHGLDVIERWAPAGLLIERIDFAGQFDPAQYERLGLIHEDLIVGRPLEKAVSAGKSTC